MTISTHFTAHDRPAPSPNSSEGAFRDDDELTLEQRAILELLDRVEALERALEARDLPGGFCGNSARVASQRRVQ